MSDIKQTTICPSCGRSVEPGFRFCDSCGQKLEPPQVTLAPEKVDLPRPPDEPPPFEHIPPKTPLLERLRERREDRDDDHEQFKPPKAEPDEPKTTPIAPIPAIPPPSKPVVEATTPAAAAWRPIIREEESVRPFSARVALVWLLHVVIAFACGALLVLLAGAIASLLSNGRTALLELRGLPIFLAGATSVIVFTLLRTGRVRSTASRQVTALTVVVGFVLLVGASAIAYRPASMHAAQIRLDRALRVYGPTEKQAVDGFQADISDWNSELDQYRNQILAPVLGSKADVNKFRFDASASEETMKGIVDRMRTHSDTANNLRIRDALNGLAAIYDDQMSGINLITRGVIGSDQPLVAQGDARYKDGQKRAVEFFKLRLKPLLERAGLDAASFEGAVTNG